MSSVGRRGASPGKGCNATEECRHSDGRDTNRRQRGTQGYHATSVRVSVGRAFTTKDTKTTKGDTRQEPDHSLWGYVVSRPHPNYTSDQQTQLPIDPSFFVTFVSFVVKIVSASERKRGQGLFLAPERKGGQASFTMSPVARKGACHLSRSSAG